jgi:hypothetical protein
MKNGLAYGRNVKNEEILLMVMGDSTITKQEKYVFYRT